jgi:hypothetical protein
VKVKVSHAVLAFFFIVAVFAGVKWAIENDVLGGLVDKVPSVDIEP